MKSLRTLLRNRLEWIEDRLYLSADKNGYGYVTPSMARLYSYLDSTPVSISELARRLNISRQAVHKLVSEGIEANFIEVFDSPNDKRIKLVRFTHDGKIMARKALDEIHQTEQELARYLGSENVKELRRILELNWPKDLN